ncbi:MAG: hypothetical protein PHS14_02085 [Elusimicrobia bacterium]|nr:hypothetical protein [Elusimicrobiota bacterium]
MRRALAAIIAACFAAPCPAAAQVMRINISLRAGAVLPSAPMPMPGSPALPPLMPSPLSLAPAAALPAITPSVAVKSVPNIPFAPVLVPVNAAPSVARPAKAAAIPALSVAVNSEPPALSALYDGSRALPSASSVPGVEPPAPAALRPAPLGSGLRVARVEHEPWLSSVVALLAGTRTGRRVLRDIDRLAASRGVPVLLDVKPIGNNGEFRYDSGLLVMDSGHLRRDPLQSAPILAHELQHVLQRSVNLPADALELEIESYTVESRVWSELGVEPEAGSFAREARRRIMKDAPAFVKWLGREYKRNIPLYGFTVGAYVARLQKNLAAAELAESRTLRKRAAVERVLASMRANGMSEDAIAAHRREDLEPLERSLRDGVVNRAWIEHDLLELSGPAARARFRAYARGVIRRARALSRP